MLHFWMPRQALARFRHCWCFRRCWRLRCFVCAFGIVLAFGACLLFGLLGLSVLLALSALVDAFGVRSRFRRLLLLLFLFFLLFLLLFVLLCWLFAAAAEGHAASLPLYATVNGDGTYSDDRQQSTPLAAGSS